jgi:hypothetical protein
LRSHIRQDRSAKESNSIEIIAAEQRRSTHQKQVWRILKPIVAKEQTANYTPPRRHRHAA